MESIIAIIVAVIGSGILNIVLTNIFAINKEKRDQTKGINQALRLLMKDRLRNLCAHYINQGWIYQDELEDLIAMHNIYHDELKGNGYLDTLMDKVKALEIKGIGVN